MADRLTTILTLAQSGLKTASTMLTLKATKLDKQADATTGAEATKLKKEANKNRKLAAALNAADAGITTYLTETEE
jgi:hypothetical protein